VKVAYPYGKGSATLYDPHCRVAECETCMQRRFFGQCFTAKALTFGMSAFAVKRNDMVQREGQCLLHFLSLQGIDLTVAEDEDMTVFDNPNR
jgi:hypothetical protein